MKLFPEIERPRRGTPCRNFLNQFAHDPVPRLRRSILQPYRYFGLTAGPIQFQPFGPRPRLECKCSKLCRETAMFSEQSLMRRDASYDA